MSGYVNAPRTSTRRGAAQERRETAEGEQRGGLGVLREIAEEIERSEANVAARIRVRHGEQRARIEGSSSSISARSVSLIRSRRGRRGACRSR
jgi:hypothetical protein